RRAAVSLGNSAYRLALCITCRNGAPFALRNLGHVYSRLACQGPVRIFLGVCLARQASEFATSRHSPTSSGTVSPYQKPHSAKWFYLVNFSRHLPRPLVFH